LLIDRGWSVGSAQAKPTTTANHKRDLLLRSTR
jgi:hypothetical protein